MAGKRHDTQPRRSKYRPPAYVSFGVIPLLGGAVGALAVAFVGVLDRIPGFRKLPEAMPLTDLAAYAAIAFVAGFVALVIKAVIWPWE